jgi:adenosylcobyric acid synthase
MPAKTLMIQGTASSVGKSIMVTALCRIFRQDGYRVAPFKSQNMSNNSFVTREGGEIGRAQAVQAEAAGIEPSIHMNPVLLKPEADNRSQVVVSGKAVMSLDARDYYEYTPHLLGIIENSLNHLRADYDIVIIEGAGSPTEINLKEREIVNMRIAMMAGSPVLLVSDIDRGGVFASIVGTMELLEQEERNMVKGMIINKFRGDIGLLKPGLAMLKKRSGKPVLGVMPFFHDIIIAQEDAVYLEEEKRIKANGDLKIAVIHLPRVSNYDDFDPLAEQGCNISYVKTVEELGSPDLIILPGTKSTTADLTYLQERGLAEAISRLAVSGTPLIGICGGYQILGKTINDPFHIESPNDNIAGLGLLDCVTTFSSEKTTTQVTACVAAGYGLLEGLTGIEFTGYEIHMGQTSNHNSGQAFIVTQTPSNKSAYPEGMLDGRGLILGTYIHGLFHNYEFTSAFVKQLRQLRKLPVVPPSLLNKQVNYDKLAQLARNSLDISQIYQIMDRPTHAY